MAIPFPSALERSPSPRAIEAMRLSEEGFEAGVAAQADDVARPEAWRRGYQRGTIFRVVAQGKALGFMGQASKCRRCGTIHWGLRSACCAVNAIDHGALIKTAETGDGPAIFMTAAKVRLMRLPLIDLTTGEPVPVERRHRAA